MALRLTPWTADARVPALVAAALRTMTFDAGPYERGREMDGRFVGRHVDQLEAVRGEYFDRALLDPCLSREEIDAIAYPDVQGVLEAARHVGLERMAA